MMASTPLICPVLVGRESELAELQLSLEACISGRGHLVLLMGEAGVGKSRLLQSLLATPEAAACAQVRVACLERDQSEPYALIFELVHAVGRRAADLPIGGAPEAERQIRRVQQALSEILAWTAGDRPLIVVAEDLHWSDDASLGVLLGFAQRPGRFLVMLSYRPEQSSPALAGFLTELNRLRIGRVVALRPLGRTEVARMVRATLQLDGPVPGALLDEVMAATDGNPFLVEEVLRSLVESGGMEWSSSGWRRRPGTTLQVPGSLRQAIEARLLPQPEQVTRVAELAAVLGQKIDMDLLRRLSRLDEADLLATLRALVAAQVIEARPDGVLAFRHALTREAILARLLDPERRILHRRMAEALTADPEVAPATLAYHWARAGEIARAAPYALEAAERAAALHAHREAIGHYELALAGGVAPAVALLIALGDQYEALGERETAVARYEAARRLAAERGEAARVAEIELRIGLAYAHERQRREALVHLTAAFEGLPPHDPARWRAGLQLALQLAALGDHARAEATLIEAQRAADNADTLARLRVVYELGGLRALRGDWTALEEAGATVLREAPEDSDEALALRHDAHAALGTMGYYRGAFDAAVEHFTTCLGIAKQRGVIGDQAMAHWNLATNAFYNLGRWSEARAELAELQALGSVGPAAGPAQWFELWLDGQWEQAAEAWLGTWSNVVEASGDLELQIAFGRRIADMLLSLGRAREALALVEKVLARIRAVQARSFELQLAPREAEALARLGGQQAAVVCKQSLALARKLGARPTEALLLRARALGHRTAGRWPEAFADCDAAVEILQALPMPYEVAKTLREAGLTRLARGRRGDREKGAEALRIARQLFADLGATRDEAATSGILSAAGLAERAERGPGPLSAREREVAELVAQGLSNREIAEQLFITEKTAAYHVGSILNKLDFNSRAQIATYVARFKSSVSSES